MRGAQALLIKLTCTEGREKKESIVGSKVRKRLGEENKATAWGGRESSCKELLRSLIRLRRGRGIISRSLCLAQGEILGSVCVCVCEALNHICDPVVAVKRHVCSFLVFMKANTHVRSLPHTRTFIPLLSCKMFIVSR